MLLSKKFIIENAHIIYYVCIQTGLSPLHVGAYYGQNEFVREMLNEVPATTRTEPAAQMNPLVVKEFSSEVRLRCYLVEQILFYIFNFNFLYC